MLLLTTLLISTALASPLPEASLTWHPGPFTSTIGSARASEKPVLVYFWSGQSGQCQELWSNTLSTSGAPAILDDFTLYSADTGTKAGYKLVERYNITTLPTLLVLDPAGQPNDVILGAISLQGLGFEIDRIESGEGTVSTLRSEVASDPSNMEARGKLAIKFRDVGLLDSFETAREEIFAMDPKFAHATTAEFRVDQLKGEILARLQESEVFDYGLLSMFLKKANHDSVKFAGWNWIAAVSDSQEDTTNGRKARVQMWKSVDEARVAKAGFNVSQYFYGLREELTRKEKSFALKVARQTLASVEGWCNEDTSESACEEGCACPSCTEGCVGHGEMLAERKLYLARAHDNLACILQMNGKRKDALAAIAASLEIDPENETYIARRDELKKRS